MLLNTPRFDLGEPLSAAKLNQLTESVEMLDVRLPKPAEDDATFPFQLIHAREGIAKEDAWRAIRVRWGNVNGVTIQGTGVDKDKDETNVGRAILVPENAKSWLVWLHVPYVELAGTGNLPTVYLWLDESDDKPAPPNADPFTLLHSGDDPRADGWPEFPFFTAFHPRAYDSNTTNNSLGAFAIPKGALANAWPDWLATPYGHDLPLISYGVAHVVIASVTSDPEKKRLKWVQNVTTDLTLRLVALDFMQVVESTDIGLRANEWVSNSGVFAKVPVLTEATMPLENFKPQESADRDSWDDVDGNRFHCPLQAPRSTYTVEGSSASYPSYTKWGELCKQLEAGAPGTK